MNLSNIGEVGKLSGKVINNVNKVMVGKEKHVALILAAMFSGGHILIEDVPGIGKTMLAKSMALSLDCTFKRVQCTPDLLPADITGSSIYNQKLAEFVFKEGPLVTQILLVDEINRTTPRTQSALLEAMEERQITTDQGTVKLPDPFLVIATQNPIELEGTFLLPEAQLDRFLFKINLEYPSREEDMAILERFSKSSPLQDLRPVVTAEDLIRAREYCRLVEVSEPVRDYIIELIYASRKHQKVELGASPRAMLNLFHASQSLAAVRGRSFVIPDDVKYLVPFVLSHRLITGMESSLKGTQASDICAEIITSVEVPVEKTGESDQ